MPGVGHGVLCTRRTRSPPAPFFSSTFKCAIEAFSAFLVQFLGGEAEAAQMRWWLGLRESHLRFAIGPRERNAWLRAMTATLEDDSVITDSRARRELIEFFEHSSAQVRRRFAEPSTATKWTPRNYCWREARPRIPKAAGD